MNKPWYMEDDDEVRCPKCNYPVPAEITDEKHVKVYLNDAKTCPKCGEPFTGEITRRRWAQRKTCNRPGK